MPVSNESEYYSNICGVILSTVCLDIYQNQEKHFIFKYIKTQHLPFDSLCCHVAQNNIYADFFLLG